MEKFSLGDIEVRLKKIRGRTLSYRILIIENAVNINVPARARKANVMEKAEEIVREGKKKGKFNELKDGGKIRLFGKDVPVCAAEAKKSSVGYYGGKIYLGLPQGEINGKVIEQIVKFYDGKLREVLEERVPAIEEKVGIKCKFWETAKMHSAYGKCKFKEGTIKFSTDLALFRTECIDMVIAHELGHIKYPDHGKEFHAFMKTYIPGYKKLSREMVI